MLIAVPVPGYETVTQTVATKQIKIALMSAQKISFSTTLLGVVTSHTT